MVSKVSPEKLFFAQTPQKILQKNRLRHVRNVAGLNEPLNIKKK
jgi:hypothetical protein